MRRSVSFLTLCAFCGVVLPAGRSLALTPEEKEVRLQLKREVFGGLEFQRAEQIGAGEADPLIGFQTEDLLFFNWEIPAENVPVLESILTLPPGFEIAPVSIVGNEQPKYYLTLNIYDVAIAGMPSSRAEWSIYVKPSPDAEPRFMVLEAQSSTPSYDPVYVQTPAAVVDYAVGDTIVDTLVEAPGTYFEAFVELPLPAEQVLEEANPEWAMANDMIYWANGVADKSFYNGMLTEAQMISIDPADVDIIDESLWSDFVDPEPENVLLFTRPVEFVLSPWYNLDDLTLPLDPAHRQTLATIKSQIYGGLAEYHAYQVYSGLAETLVEFTVGGELPAYYIDFRVPEHRAADLAAAIDLPAGLELAKVKVVEGQHPEYMITLNVYEAFGISPGFRAEWSVYVAEEAAPARAYFMVIDVESENPSLDVVDLFTPPAWVFDYTVDDGVLSTYVASDGLSFSAVFETPEPADPPVSLSPDWLAANDRIYWSNGVYDRCFYNGLFLDAELAAVSPSDVVIDDQTPWSAFVDPTPLHVLVSRNRFEFALQPWFNLEEL